MPRDLLPDHPEHLVLLHLELIAVGGSTECTVAVLSLDVFVIPFSVVSRGEIGIRILVDVALIINAEIITTTESWTTAAVATNEVVILVGDHLLLEIQLQQESPSLSIANMSIIDLVPLVVGEPGDCPAKLSADQGQGVRDVVAFRMEGSQTECMLRGFEEQFDSPGVVQRSIKELLSLCRKG